MFKNTHLPYTQKFIKYLNNSLVNNKKSYLANKKLKTIRLKIIKITLDINVLII